jgi:predicted Zn-dependent protease
MRNPFKPSWMVLAALLITVGFTFAQRVPKPSGFNMFSKEQELQLGQEAAAEVEKKAKLITHPEVVAYIQGIGKRLAQANESGGYPYTFKVVLDDSINAFALPGGPTYVNTGLILAADNEGQLAGVMGHEISHVALRHGTKQASKSSLIGLGASLGGVAGGGMLGQLAEMGIGLGANSVLLKYSRGAESDADLLGARIMAQAGYNPMEAARFFEKLEAETGKRSGIEQFFSSHPNPGNRSQRIEKELQYLPKGPYQGDTGKLPQIQAILRKTKAK